jgi:hypothetical protein
LGVPELVKRNPETQCVLLDDAFQHLAVTPGLNILLTEFAPALYPRLASAFRSLAGRPLQLPPRRYDHRDQMSARFWLQAAG